MSKLLTIRQAADLMEVSTKTVYRTIHDGRLTMLKIRGSSRIMANDVEEYIENSKVGHCA